LQALLNLPQAGAAADALERMIDVAMAGWPMPARSRVQAARKA
jgi:TetR/AcrR family transcriptional regulator, copper-responsive repressor